MKRMTLVFLAAALTMIAQPGLVADPVGAACCSARAGPEAADVRDEKGRWDG